MFGRSKPAMTDWSKLKVHGTSTDVLQHKANLLAGKLVLNSKGMAEAITKFEPLEKLGLSDKAYRINLECLGLNLEVTSRLAFNILAPKPREIFCNFLDQSVFQLFFMDNHLLDPAAQQTLIDHLNEVQGRFVDAKQLFVAPGEPPKDTLLWEFAKYLGLEVLGLPDDGTIFLYQAIYIQFGIDSADTNIPQLLKL